MNDSNHISKANFIMFQQDVMEPNEKKKFLEHISSCDYCADQFAALMSEEIIAAPRDMKANILKATNRLDVQLAMKARETSKRMQLFIYSLRVGTATICALLLLLLTMNLSNITSATDFPEEHSLQTSADNEDFVSLTSSIRDGMDTISNSMLDFSNTIMRTEVSDNDQKEK